VVVVCVKVVPGTDHSGRVPDVGSAVESKANGERRRSRAKGRSHGHTGERTAALAHTQGERQEHGHRGRRTLSDEEEVEGGEGALIPKTTLDLRKRHYRASSRQSK